MNSKRELILKYVVPALGNILSTEEDVIDKLLLHCRLHPIITFQFIESPGSWEDGHIWFSIDAMTHSYYTYPDRQKNYGRQIWKKREFIFDSQSFYEKKDRSDYIQAIEPGTFISISYPVLSWLNEHFPSINRQLIRLSQIQQQYYRSHMQLLNNPPFEKVSAFKEAHPLFAKVANNTINGMHIGLSRQGYERQIKKLKI